MIGKLKDLGLAFVAVAAMSAFSASTAQAGELDIGLQPASLFAHSESFQNHVFTLRSTNGSQFNTSCPTASLEGTTQGQKINEATVTATYGPNCTAFGVAAQVLMNGCKYTLTGAGDPANSAAVDIVGCTFGKQIEIKTAICTLDIPEQNSLWHVVGSNLSASEVTLRATIKSIQVRQTGAACPDGNNHVTILGGSFTGNSILRARADFGGSLVTNHSHQYTELHQFGITTTVAST